MSGCSLSTAAPAVHRLLSTPIRPAAAAALARLCHGLDGGGACLSFELVSRKPWKEVRRKQRCSPGSEVSCGFLAEPALEVGFVVVNFYKFVFIEDPGEEVTKHLAFLQGRDVHGRIYINEQGINAQYSGPVADAMAYVEWLKEDDRLSDVLVQISPTLSGHAFPRLKLRYKPSLVQLEGAITHLPLLDLTMRATPLEPSDWRKKILCIPSLNDSLVCDQSNTGRNFLLLDFRNGYEWDIGHFDGPQRPNVDSFRVSSFGPMESETSCLDPLSNVDKEKTDILMYCTGGIRCDVYSTILRQKGFRNLYTLKGGVSHYLKSEGPVGWIGNLFVFDARLSVPPSVYRPESAIEENVTVMPKSNSTLAKCYVCGSKVHLCRHRNCANLDCNLLFLSCSNCEGELKGCCCIDCKSAPRLRPVLPGNQRYEKWHIYRDAVQHV